MTSVLGKNVFLSGPMSDDTAYFHADDFVKAHAVVKSCGARTVYNPAIQWLQYNDAPRTHEQWMHACVSELTQPKHTMNGDFATFYDVLVSLNGWERSDGATVERTVAEACGIEVCELSDVCA